MTPEEFDRLAAAFRPSWELDEPAPNAAPAFPAFEVRSAPPAGAHASVPAPTAVNGTHAPPKPTVSQEPESSVIIDRSIREPASPPAAVAEARRSPMAAQTAPVAAAAQRPWPPAASASTARRGSPSWDLEATGSVFAKPSKKPLVIGLGAVAIALVVGGVWAMSGGSDKPATSAASVPPPTEKAAADKIAAIPPPPPETVAAPPPPPPAPTVASAPPPPVMAAPAMAAPVLAAPAMAQPQSPQTRVTTAQPAPRPTAAAAPAKPAGRPKGQTIVRDVPF